MPHEGDDSSDMDMDEKSRVVLLKCTLHQVLLIAVKEMGVKSIQKL